MKYSIVCLCQSLFRYDWIILELVQCTMYMARLAGAYLNKFNYVHVQ